MAFGDEDLDIFFDTNEFCVTATFSLLAGVASIATAIGIFDNAFAVVKLEGGIEVESRHPAFTCAAADAPGVIEGDTLSIGGVTYYVTDPMPDGTGLITLLLSKN